jgi:hypothetical protein
MIKFLLYDYINLCFKEKFMEQVASLETRDLKMQRPNRRFGNHVPNRYLTINPVDNPVFNQFSNLAGLNISLGSSVSFYVNKLDHNQFSELLESLPDTNSKKRINKSQQKDKPLNWINAISFTPQGKKPCLPIEESINIYNGFDIDKDGRRIISYGYADLTFDFSKLPLVKAKDGYPAYPFGIMFFSDLYNNYDNYSVVISCIPERKNDVSRCSYIYPVDFFHKGPVHCSGKFKTNGNYIIFYVANEIEKQESALFPDVTIINIPVTVFRDHKQGHIIKETGICNIRKGSTCVSSFVDHIVDILKYYGVTDVQFIGEIIHASGYDPVEYNYPPSLGDERSYYYGGNKVRMGSKENHLRHTKSFAQNNSKNVFSYLNAINEKNNAKIVVKAPLPDSDKKGKTKKEVDNNSSENIGENPSITKEEMEQVDDEVMDAAATGGEITGTSEILGEEVNAGPIENEDTVVEDSVVAEEEVKYEVAQINEESPQSDDIETEEEAIENGNN